MTWITDLFDNKIEVNRIDLELDFLRKCEYNDVDFFSLNGWSGWAKVVKLYDGDTMTVVIFLNNKPFKFRVRFSDIDSAEKTSKDPQEVVWANKAIDRCLEFMGEEMLVYLKCHRMDKYGRVLASVYNNHELTSCLNTLLVGEGLAYDYKGGKRVPFKEWALFEETEDAPTLTEEINDSEVINY